MYFWAIFSYKVNKYKNILIKGTSFAADNSSGN